MNPLPALCLSLLCACLLSCFISCATSPEPTPLPQPTPRDPTAELSGAWISTDIQARAHTSCPWIIELFDDGTLDTNFLSDDRGAQCMFWRLPYKLDPGRDPPLLEVGGQLSRCIYQLDGDRLLLACEDHGTPRVDDDQWIEFHRLEVREGEGLKDLAGTWLPPSFWGSAEPWVIDASGTLSIGGEPGRLELDGADHLVLKLGEQNMRCRYRVTTHRLALSCEREPDLVFYRTGD